MFGKILLMSGLLFLKIFGSELLFFGCRCWSCVCWCCFAYVFALCFGGSLPKLSGTILLMSGFFAVWFLCFLRSGFGFGFSSLLFLLLLPPFCSWGRLGSLFLPSLRLHGRTASNDEGRSGLHHDMFLFFFFFSFLSARAGSPLPLLLFSPSLSLLSLSLAACVRLRNTPTTVWSSMTGSERPSPELLLMREASPTVLGGENSGDALEASYALNYRDWGIPTALSRGIPGYALRAFPGSFRFFPALLPEKSQPYWGCGPFTARNGWATFGKCIVIGFDHCNF